MSLYIEWMNLIKSKANVSWLLKSQVPVYNALQTQWLRQRFVNLYGPPGSGKSFLGRLLASQNKYLFTTDLNEVPEGSKNIVLDDASYVRSLRILASERNLSHIILITQTQVNEAMPAVELRLNDTDVGQFQGVLAKYCQIYFTDSVPEGYDLHEIIIHELQNRGEAKK